MIRKRKIILVLAFVLLAGCEKDDDTVTKGRILLTTEKHQSQQKTSVEGTTVQWEGNDKDTIRFYVGGYEAKNYFVYVNEGEACVDIEKERTGDVRAYYPTTIITAIGAQNGNTDNPTVVIPNRYDSYFSSSGRQVLALPMVAKGNTSNEKVEFKHLTAAINVKIKNSIGSELKLDRVVVSSKDYQLSGTMQLSFADGTNLGVVAQSVTNDSNAVTVRLTDNPAIADEGTITVQVPILPIGETAKPLRIEVFAYRQGSLIGGSGVPMVYSTKIYHYNDAKSVSSLGRNVMMNAGIEIKTPGAGIHTTTEDIDNSLFSVSGSKKVHFSKGNLKQNGDNWEFNANQYSSTASDLFQWSVVNGWSSSTSVADNTGWSVLTSDEWNYLINSRSGNRFAKARVADVNGLILFSDSYVQPSGITLNHVNDVSLSSGGSANYSDFNNFTAAEWTQMEAAGAIFLPAVHNTGGEGHYWSSTSSNDTEAKRFYFSVSELYTTNSEPKTNTCSVRLVRSN